MQLVIIPWISLAVHFSSSLFNIRIFCNVISTCKIHQKFYKIMLGTYLRLCVGLQAGGKDNYRNINLTNQFYFRIKWHLHS